MSYSACDFMDTILDALGVNDRIGDLDHEAFDDPSTQADLAIEEIDRLHDCQTALKDALEYVVRFADLNDEPRNGDCRQLIGHIEKALKPLPPPKIEKDDEGKTEDA